MSKKVNEWISDNKIILIIVLVHVVISVGLFAFWYDKVVVVPDTMSYVSIANNLISQGFFSQDGINPDYFRTPGFPLFLAAIFMLGGNLISVVAIQIVLSAITIWFVYSVIFMLSNSKPYAALGSGYVLFDICMYQYAHCVLSETLFMFLVTLSVFAITKFIKSDKDSWFILFVFALNYALAVRPILIYFNLLASIVLLGLTLLKKVKWKQALLFTLTFVVVFCGWSYRNYIHSGIFEYSGVRGLNLLLFDGTVLNSRIENISEEAARENMNALFNEKTKDINMDELNQMQIYKLQGEVGSEYIKNHMGQYVMQNVRGLFTTMLGPSISFLNEIFGTGIVNKLMKFAYAGYLLLTYLLYVMGVLLCAEKKKWQFANVYIFLIAGYLAVASASLGYGRFRTAFFPILTITAFSLLPLCVNFFVEKRGCRFHKV